MVSITAEITPLTSKRVDDNISKATTNMDECTNAEPSFDVILRRQLARTSGKPKFKAVPSRFLNLSDDFEFAGWGSMYRIGLSPDDLSHGRSALLQLQNQRVLGQFAGSALAANDILGGVFYTLPAVFAISGV